MKCSLFSRIMMLSAAMLLVTSAYASGATHKASFHVSDPVQVNGKQLPVGDYTVTWDGEGPDVNVHISRGNQEMATSAAKVVALDSKASDDATEVSNSNGTRALSALQFSGKKFRLDLGGSSAGAGSYSSTK